MVVGAAGAEAGEDAGGLLEPCDGGWRVTCGGGCAGSSSQMGSGSVPMSVVARGLTVATSMPWVVASRSASWAVAATRVTSASRPVWRSAPVTVNFTRTSRNVAREKGDSPGRTRRAEMAGVYHEGRVCRHTLRAGSRGLAAVSQSRCPVARGARSIGRQPPLELELDFLLPVAALVLEVDDGIRRNADPLAGDLDLEAPALLNRIRQAAQLGDELLRRVILLDVARPTGPWSRSPGGLALGHE